ncbi:DUF4236 domain-containing protein [Mycobacterium avium]|uniref:DUF4236 domain-containing protein n=1 Tax=Mycobacterium avium TaxID=1764 RepID=UPI001CC6F9D4|nr:DUF4236 domain-containing protein [Mycobacterium avium]MBZ4580914.1 DUF4236 domain-containing protein [Mycobacterium avium subsp. hominissuis]MBZ4608814.1 DUF4236 domain-containing protein [Mycobacterium avium subsp. hominissuis]
MVQYRKSKSAGPFRFTVSNRGISTSVGYGPMRVTRRADGRYQRTARIPGTGIRDTKIIGSPRRAPAVGQPQASGELSVLGATVAAGFLFVLSGLLAWVFFAAGVVWLGVIATLFAVLMGAGLLGGIVVGLAAVAKKREQRG